MEVYKKSFEIRWSDLDPNSHIRHSVYYDFGAFVRMSFLTDYGLGVKELMENNIGPILFKEECQFKREILFGDKVSINIELYEATEIYSRWSIRHHIIKEDTVAAILQVQGAWIDTTRRKLTVPSAIVSGTFGSMPRSSDFAWIKR